MDPRRRQLALRVINGMENNVIYAKKLGLDDVSTYRGKRCKEMALWDRDSGPKSQN